MSSHFLASGVYGCVYHPGFTCKGLSMKSKKWVSKLTYDDKIAKNEIEVGKRLKKCPNSPFVIVEQSCSIPYKALTKAKECDAVKKGHPYRLLYSKYIPSKELGVYLKEASFSKVFRCYYHLCEIISTLIEYHIVHHDMHFGNVLYADNSKLKVIDFGLSIMVDQLDSPTYQRQVFSSYMPKWIWYPLEIHVITYCVNYGPLTTDRLEHLLYTYVEHLVQTFPMIHKGFREKCLDFFIPWIGKDPIDYLCQFWHTWDYYNLALRFMYMNQIYGYKEFDKILYEMIDPNPLNRPSVIQIRSHNHDMIRSFDLDRLSKIDSFPKELSL